MGTVGYLTLILMLGRLGTDLPGRILKCNYSRVHIGALCLQLSAEVRRDGQKLNT